MDELQAQGIIDDMTCLVFAKLSGSLFVPAKGGWQLVRVDGGLAFQLSGTGGLS